MVSSICFQYAEQFGHARRWDSNRRRSLRESATFEVAGNEFDRLLAHEVFTPQQQHRSVPPYLGLEDPGATPGRQFACSSELLDTHWGL